MIFPCGKERPSSAMLAGWPVGRLAGWPVWPYVALYQMCTKRTCLAVLWCSLSHGQDLGLAVESVP